MRTVTLIPMKRPKGKVRVQLGPKEDTTDIFKDRAVWLLDSLNAYYSHRSDYCLSPAKAEAFLRLYRGGWEPSRKFFASNHEPYTYSRPGHENLTLKQALALCGPANKTQPGTPTP